MQRKNLIIALVVVVLLALGVVTYWFVNRGRLSTVPLPIPSATPGPEAPTPGTEVPAPAPVVPTPVPSTPTP